MDLEKHCDKNMRGLQSVHEQKPRIENKEYEEITFEDGKDAISIGSLRENFEQCLTKSDEDLVDVLVDLCKKNSVRNIDINKGLNISNVGDQFPKVFPPETDQNKTAVFNDSSMPEKKSKAKGSVTEDGHLKGYFCSKTIFKSSKKL